MKFLEIAGNFQRNPDWNVIRDIKVRGGIVHDMTDLPIPEIDDNTYDGTYSEHFLEHLTKDQGIAFLKEMYRVSKPNSTIRIIWPSMDFVDHLNSNTDLNSDKFVCLYYINLVINNRAFDHPYYKNDASIKTLSKQKQVAYRMMHQEGEHKCLWYKDDLIKCLTEIGFVDAKEEPYQKSRLKEFNNIDNRQELRPLSSCVIEATKL